MRSNHNCLTCATKQAVFVNVIHRLSITVSYSSKKKKPLKEKLSSEPACEEGILSPTQLENKINN